MEQLSRGSQYLLEVSQRDVENSTTACQKWTYRGLLTGAGVASAGTEAFWIPVYLNQGSGGIQYAITTGSATSMWALKFFCYKDLIEQAMQSESAEEVEALGIKTSKLSTYARLAVSFGINSVILFPIAWQVGHDDGSLVSGIIGGYGDSSVSTYAIDLELRTLFAYDGYTRERRQLNAMRNELAAQIGETIRLCNRGEICAYQWLENIKDIGSLREWSVNYCSPVPESSGNSLEWLASRMMDITGLALTGSHLWMMGGLTYNGTTNVTGNEEAGYAAATISSALSLKFTWDSIGTTPRNLYEGVVGWWKGERPLFPQYNRMRVRLIAYSLVLSSFAFGSALDGANQTTNEGIERDIQRPMASIGLGLMSFWALVGIINSGLKEGARKSDDPEVRLLAEAIDKLEQIQGLIFKMSAERFATFLLDLHEDKRHELLGVTGDSAETRLDDNDLRRIGKLPQIWELDDL